MIGQPRVLIVGSEGRMGTMLIRRFSAAGADVRALDGLHTQPPDAASLRTLLADVHVIMLCVPVSALRTVLATLVPHTPAGCIVADITSVKVTPMQVMETLWDGPVVGTHPLFGPTTSEDLRVTIVPGAGASEADTALVEGLFRGGGCTTFRSTAEEHDKAMAAIQGLNFISSLAYFATLAHRDDLRPFITPSFVRRQESAKKLLTEDAPMFEAIFEANPYSHDLVRQYRYFLSIAAAGDTSLLVRRADWWWEGEDNTSK